MPAFFFNYWYHIGVMTCSKRSSRCFCGGRAGAGIVGRRIAGDGALHPDRNQLCAWYGASVYPWFTWLHNFLAPLDIGYAVALL